MFAIKLTPEAMQDVLAYLALQWTGSEAGLRAFGQPVYPMRKVAMLTGIELSKSL